MKIALAAEGQGFNDTVSELFGSCKCLMVVNMQDLSRTVIKNDGDCGSEKLARAIIEYDCEAVITGIIDPVEFDILADACVTRFYGAGHTVRDALDLMERNLLKCIRNSEGTDECRGNHHSY